jgi:hypothetical protein
VHKNWQWRQVFVSVSFTFRWYACITLAPWYFYADVLGASISIARDEDLAF